VARKPNPNY